MAVVTIPIAVDNVTPLDAAYMNKIRHNLLETAPAKATEAGQMFVSNGVGSITVLPAPTNSNQFIVSNSANQLVVRNISYNDLTGNDPVSEQATTAGDTLYWNGSAFSRIPIGANNTLYLSNGSRPEWQSVVSQVSYTNLDNNGDVGQDAGQVAIGTHTHRKANLLNSQMGCPMYR